MTLLPQLMQHRSYIPSSRVAVVCSARSSHTKALGTTNLLLQASREALRPPTPTDRPSQSGTQTPFYPKRVGSGFFGNGPSREASTSRAEKDMSSSMMSSISSLRDIDLRSSSPSPFQPSGRSRSPTSPTTPGAGAFNIGPSEPSAAFHDTVDTLKKGHLEAAKDAVRPGPMRIELEEEIERDCESLRSFLSAAQVCCVVAFAGLDGTAS